jgi:hypothetical protein
MNILFSFSHTGSYVKTHSWYNYVFYTTFKYLCIPLSYFRCWPSPADPSRTHHLSGHFSGKILGKSWENTRKTPVHQKCFFPKFSQKPKWMILIMKGSQMELIWMSLDVYHLPRNPCQNASCRRSTSDAKKKRLSAARSASQRDKRDGLSWVYHQRIQDTNGDLVRPMDIYTYVFCSYAYAHHFRWYVHGLSKIIPSRPRWHLWPLQLESQSQQLFQSGRGKTFRLGNVDHLHEFQQVQYTLLKLWYGNEKSP